MSVSLDLPQLRKMLSDLERRIGILERRTTPYTPSGTDNHDGSGVNSVRVARSDDSTADASGSLATAVGYLTIASGDSAVALGETAEAQGESSIAIGDGALVDADYGIAIGTSTGVSGQWAVAIGNGASTNFGDHAVAIGDGAAATGGGSVAIGQDSSATHAYSVALGKDVATTASTQINGGNQHRVYFHCPTTQATNGHLIASQITFWVDQDAFAPLLWFQVKYSDGTTVKQGSIPLG